MNDELSDSDAKLREIIAKQLLTITALNSCIGGKDSLTADILTALSRLENEIENLKHDIGEYIKISNELANDIIQAEVELTIAVDTLKYVDMWMEQTILGKGSSTMVEDLMTVRIKETLKKIDGSTNFYCNEKQLENLCESYHKSKCVDIKPVGRVIWRNGESFVDWVTGYFSEAGTKIFTTPQPSDAEAKMKEGVPPKDGRTYLGYFPSREGYFASQCFIPICWSEWGGGTWDNVISGHHIPENPTHWTDLPLSPNQALERIGES